MGPIPKLNNTFSVNEDNCRRTLANGGFKKLEVLLLICNGLKGLINCQRNSC
ncbi:protein of unknown function [Magnetospirillum gryphiswaldense MSR-1 v2]|uniref:Transposase n=1 Tax=Magnetospirillum gryphiswaldense (strain DSM 6361 / JCM 21280 / NBRC 15271 / MSR-1) TaxID=431944 RepID=V6F343_MAGGM|nr:protein of unknown function [Magnetospirillum gryphiswaldense MSR-1 v2]